LPIPPGATIVASDQLRLLQTGFRVGATDRFYLFRSRSLSIAPLAIQVLRKETLRIGDRAVDTYVVLEGDGERDWFTEDGQLLKVEVETANVRVLRDDLEQPHVSASAPRDEMDTAAVPVDRMIGDPRHVYMLSLKVTGIAASSLVLSDGRQRANADGGTPALAAVYDVQAAFPPEHGA